MSLSKYCVDAYEYMIIRPKNDDRLKDLRFMKTFIFHYYFQVFHIVLN